MSARRRSMGAFKPAPLISGIHRNTSCAHTAWTQLFASYSPCQVGVVKTMDDVVTPRFQVRRSKGEMFFNPMTITQAESTIESYGALTYHGTTIACAGTGAKHEISISGPYSVSVMWPAGASGPIPSRPQIPIRDIESLITEVTTKGMAERGRSSNNLFESVAEYRQTLKLLSSPIKSFHRFITNTGPKIKLMRPDEAWLTYRYGVLPLIKDVTGIIKGLEQKTGHKRETTRAKGEISESRDESLSLGPGVGVLFTYVANTTDYVKVRYTSIDEYIASVASNIGFTAKGFLTVPWELIPYSFVADWFANVGDYLNAIAPAPGYKSLGSCVVIERGTYTRYQHTGASIAGYIVDTVDNCIFNGVTYSKTRRSVGAPGVVIKSDFRLSSFTRSADALALIGQKLFQLFGKR